MAHLIVDGYNAIRRIPRLRTAERASLAEGREALLLELEAFGAASGHHIVCVFDGAGFPGPAEERDELERFAGVDVVFSRPGRPADDLVVEWVRRGQNGALTGGVPEEVIVVSADGEIRREAMGLGAFVIDPMTLAAAFDGEPLTF